jgi:hypothetical protein
VVAKDNGPSDDGIMWYLWEEEAVLSAREEEFFYPMPLRKRWEEPTGESGAGASETMLCAATVAQPSGVPGVESTPDAESTPSRFPPIVIRKSLLFHEMLERKKSNDSVLKFTGYDACN